MQWLDLLLIGGLAAIVLAALLLRTATGRARRGASPFERRWPSSARPWAMREPRIGPGEDRSTSTVVPFRSPLAEVGLPGQLESVERSSYRTRTIMSKAEFRVFRIVESEIRSLRLKHRAFAQVSLGEILACDDPDGFRWINSKRADIVVVDAFGNPVVAVEFQGQGHTPPLATRSSGRPCAGQASPILRFSPINRMTISGRCCVLRSGQVRVSRQCRRPEHRSLLVILPARHRRHGRTVDLSRIGSASALQT